MSIHYNGSSFYNKNFNKTKLVHTKKVKSQLMVAPEKYIVLQMKQCFLVHPNKLSLPDLASKFKISQ